MSRVAVIGFDGATWRLLDRLVGEGRLPNIARLLDEGSRGVLWSTVPPVTFPAWHSMLSGLNPGKVGVYGFAQVDVESRRYVLNTPGSFMGDPVWRIAGVHGVRSLVINVPTARVEPVRGAIVGGPFTAGRLVYPREYEPLLREAGYEAYPEALSKAMLHRGSRPRLEDVRAAIGSRFRLARLLLERVKPGLLVLVVFVIDNIQHFYWGDPLVEEAWGAIDEELGRLLPHLEGYNILLVSDHGFTEGRATVSTTRALIDHGLVVLRRRSAGADMGWLVEAAQRLGIGRLARRLPWLYPRLASLASRLQRGEWVGAKAMEAMIDWDRSPLIPVDSLLYVNPRACRSRDECMGEARRVLERIPGVRRVIAREEVYTGPMRGAPDLIVEGEPGVDVIDTPNAPSPMVPRLLRPRWRAIHEPQGILAAWGPDMPQGYRLEAEITSIAPTVLSLLGVPPDPGMDGAPIKELAPDTPQPGGGTRGRLSRRVRESLRRRRG